MRLKPALNRLLLRSLFVGLAATAVAAASIASPPQPRRTDRPQPWRQYSSPEQAGFDSASLDKARAFADGVKSGAVMIVYRGAVVVAWGAVERNFMAHSVRKSLAGALYGIAAADKRLNLDATLADLKVDDDPPLTEGEKQARVRDLLAARSGVYHAAAYADSSQDTSRPARGSHPPGTFWFYNNWDFNTAETIFESVTGEDLYASFAKRIAAPIGMEDYSPANGFEALEPGQSRIPAHTVRISARDLARFGVLYEGGGRWAGKQIVPAEWIRESLRSHSEFGNGSGYGYLWWTYGPGSLGEKYPIADRLSIQLARGTGGQVLFLLPSEDLVVVHRADTDNNRSVAGPQVWGLLEQILAARTAKPANAPTFTGLKSVAFESQAPAPPPAAFLSIDEASRRRVAGEYDIGGGAAVRVFEYQNRLFIDVPARGTAELFALARNQFTIKVVAGVKVDFSEDANGVVEKLAMALGPQRIEGRRRGTPPK